MIYFLDIVLCSLYVVPVYEQRPAQFLRRPRDPPLIPPLVRGVEVRVGQVGRRAPELGQQVLVDAPAGGDQGREGIIKAV